MSEWWTYRPSDFLMFSARSYHRLFELYNAALWPAQLVVMALGVLLLGVLVWGGAKQPPSAWPQRLGCAMLAAAWLWIGFGYHAQRFASINTAASAYAVAWMLQALVLLALALTLDGRKGDAPARTDVGRPRGRAHAVGLGLLVYAVALHPGLGLGLGRPIGQAEIAGLAPDPTAVATLGLLLLMPRASTPLQRGLQRAAWALALAWCAVSWLTLAGLGAPEAWLPPMLAAMALAAAWRERRRLKAS